MTEADTKLATRLRQGAFVVTAELPPPVATDAEAFIARALPLKGLATAVNVTDGAGARPHMSSLAAAHFLLSAGIEPILQMACRDKNRLALQSELLGAVALGVHNVMFQTGDDPSAGDQPEAKPVFDLDAVALLAIAQRMKTENALPSGTEIKGEVKLFLGATDAPLDPPPNWRPEKLIRKLEAGAQFLQTQFCMDAGVVRRYAARLIDLGLAQRAAFLIGVAPIPSARSALWMREKLPGTIIPDALIERLERAEDSKAEGRKICAELLQELTEIPGVAGAHVMAPQSPAAIPEVIEAASVIHKKRARIG
jgi:methylenetetrahydrofolate reductase (NADPH)